MSFPIHCWTELKVIEQWPSTGMVAVPQVGHKIQSRLMHKDGFQLELVVVEVVWKYSDFVSHYVPHIELHASESRNDTGFAEWYALKTKTGNTTIP